MDILHGIESKALALRGAPPAGSIMEIAESRAAVELPLERPLFAPTIRPVIAALDLLAGDENIDPSALFDQVVVDKVRLVRHIRHALQDRAQISLGELVAGQPLQHGLAELLTYLHLGSEMFSTAVDEATPEPVGWQTLSSNELEVIRSA